MHPWSMKFTSTVLAVATASVIAGVSDCVAVDDGERKLVSDGD